MGKVHVTLFAAARDAAECEAAEISWEGDGALSGQEFWALLDARFPRLAASRSGMRLARNLEYLPEDGTVRPGDEVAVIPPVSGG
jgi:molybdopterin converting factor small subunit